MLKQRNRFHKMLELLLAEENADSSYAADILRRMVEEGGHAIADIYGDADLHGDSSKAEFLIVLEQFTLSLWLAAVPIVMDDPKKYNATFNNLLGSMRSFLTLNQNRVDVLEYYAKSTRTMQ